MVMEFSLACFMTSSWTPFRCYLDSTKGDLKGTMLSTTLMAEGKNIDCLRDWEGTIRLPYKMVYRTGLPLKK